MEIPQWIKDIPPFVSAGVACLALLISCIHTIIAVINYRRDRHKVRVDLKWNAEETSFQGAKSPVKRLGHITVTNVGRRPVTIDFVGLHLPGRKRVISWLEVGETVRLEEESAPIVKKIHQDSTLEPFVDNWRKIRASASDTAGREYRSRHGGERPIVVPGVNEETRRRLQEPRYIPPPREPRFVGLSAVVEYFKLKK